MTDRLLSQLDRRLARTGDMVTLRRYLGTDPSGPKADLAMKAFVKGLEVERLVAGISQQSWFVITSPTPLLADGWPRVAPAKGRLIAAGSIARVPIVGDKVFVNLVERHISRAVPIFIDGMCVRIELTATG